MIQSVQSQPFSSCKEDSDMSTAVAYIHGVFYTMEEEGETCTAVVVAGREVPLLRDG